LRFSPPAAPGEAGATATAPGRTFIQSLTPMPPRRFNNQAPDGDASAKSSDQIWVLRDGQPAAIPVKTGLNDGRQVEISADTLDEGLPVILHTTTTAAQ